MPFESQAQRRWMYANHPAMAKRWSDHTPKGKALPERVRPPGKKQAASPGWDASLSLFNPLPGPAPAGPPDAAAGPQTPPATPAGGAPDPAQALQGAQGSAPPVPGQAPPMYGQQPSVAAPPPVPAPKLALAMRLFEHAMTKGAFVPAAEAAGLGAAAVSQAAPGVAAPHPAAAPGPHAAPAAGAPGHPGGAPGHPGAPGGGAAVAPAPRPGGPPGAAPASPDLARGRTPGFTNPMPGSPNPLGAGSLAYGGTHGVGSRGGLGARAGLKAAEAPVDLGDAGGADGAVRARKPPRLPRDESLARPPRKPHLPREESLSRPPRKPRVTWAALQAKRAKGAGVLDEADDSERESFGLPPLSPEARARVRAVQDARLGEAITVNRDGAAKVAGDLPSYIEPGSADAAAYDAFLARHSAWKRDAGWLARLTGHGEPLPPGYHAALGTARGAALSPPAQRGYDVANQQMKMTPYAGLAGGLASSAVGASALAATGHAGVADAASTLASDGMRRALAPVAGAAPPASVAPRSGTSAGLLGGVGAAPKAPGVSAPRASAAPAGGMGKAAYKDELDRGGGAIATDQLVARLNRPRSNPNVATYGGRAVKVIRGVQSQAHGAFSDHGRGTTAKVAAAGDAAVTAEGEASRTVARAIPLLARGALTYGGVGGALGAAKAPSGHGGEGLRRGALAGLGAYAGVLGGGTAGLALAGGDHPGLGMALGALGGGVLGHTLANRLMGRPSWETAEAEEAAPAAKAAAAIPLLGAGVRPRAAQSPASGLGEVPWARPRKASPWTPAGDGGSLGGWGAAPAAATGPAAAIDPFKRPR